MQNTKKEKTDWQKDRLMDQDTDRQKDRLMDQRKKKGHPAWTLRPQDVLLYSRYPESGFFQIPEKAVDILDLLVQGSLLLVQIVHMYKLRLRL